MDWDAYRYFLAVAETGSLSAAARALKVSQPTVGRQVQVLEQTLEVRLFDRRPDGYAVTDAGLRILELVRDIDGVMQVISRRVGGEKAKLAGKVRITAAQGIGTYWLPQQVHRLMQQYPEIQIELSVCIPTLDLGRHQADIAIRLGDPGDDSLIGRRVAKVSFGLFAAASYLARRGEPRRLEDLAGHDIIESSGEIADLPQARILRDHAAGGRTVGFACDNLVTQFSAMAAGCGLLAAPLYMADAASGIKRVLAESFDVEMDLWLLTHRDHQETARMRAVIEHLCDAVRRDRQRFTGR
ncbi:LysR family transcriptional regulator [Pelagibius sp.]|uniref:LysR family transcriptional regulator n=1 Tax=Pelagibius sp. TaxID=1931238 RepID=UPI002639944E|nr:LysR family transcriptional regulator [Pelagibius sp.]